MQNKVLHNGAKLVWKKLLFSTSLSTKFTVIAETVKELQYVIDKCSLDVSGEWFLVRDKNLKWPKDICHCLFVVYLVCVKSKI